MARKKEKYKVHPNDFLYVEETPNYVVQKIRKDPPDAIKYRRKVVYDKHGYRHLLTIAVVSRKGKRGGRTVLTSIWHPKREPKAQDLLRLAKRRGKLKRSKMVKKQRKK